MIIIDDPYTVQSSPRFERLRQAPFGGYAEQKRHSQREVADGAYCYELTQGGRSSRWRAAAALRKPSGFSASFALCRARMVTAAFVAFGPARRRRRNCPQ